MNKQLQGFLTNLGFVPTDAPEVYKLTYPTLLVEFFLTWTAALTGCGMDMDIPVEVRCLLDGGLRGDFLRKPDDDIGFITGE